MKKLYITPAIGIIGIHTAHMLTLSQNEYSNDQGRIKFSSSEVSAEDAD